MCIYTCTHQQPGNNSIVPFLNLHQAECKQQQLDGDYSWAVFTELAHGDGHRETL